MIRRAVAITAALAAIVPAAAAGSAGVRARTASAVVDPFSTATAAASCPVGSVPVGGGFRTATNEVTGLVVSSLVPVARTGWAVGATNEFVNAGSVTAIAYCGARTPLRRVVASATLPAQSGTAYPDATVTAICPRGTNVRFGGFAAATSPQPDGAGVVVNRMERASPRRWTVSASNAGPAAGSLQAVAECGPGPRLVKVERALTLPAQGGVHAMSATCPRRRSIALGGFRATPYDGDGPYVSQLERASRGRWTSAAFHFPGRAAQLVAIAYCA